MDRDLVERARKADREAFAVLVHQVSDSLYVFDWSNSTFNGSQHLTVDQFKQVLATVTFTTP